MKKRVVSLLLALGMCFGLTACGQGDGGESTADNGDRDDYRQNCHTTPG